MWAVRVGEWVSVCGCVGGCGLSVWVSGLCVWVSVLVSGCVGEWVSTYTYV